VSLRDLPSTVVDLLGLSADSPFPGRSLARAWSGRAQGDAPGPLLSEIDLPPEADPNGGRSPVCRGSMVSLVSGGWHYIKNGDGREELYDFAHDPGEERNLAGSAAGRVVVRAMRETVVPAGEHEHEKGVMPGGPRSSPAALARGRPSRDARPR
jgi:arylsulfatase A-like enzyme